MTPPEFGATAWGRAWVRTIERTTGPPNPLLPKARSLARNHAVALSLAPGRVAADVVDRGTAHRVRLDVPLWPEPARSLAARLIADAATTDRSLATGDLPDALEAELSGRGIATATEPDADTSGCDCRTRRRPCVHVLAAVYALAQLVDERPVLAMELRSVEVAPAEASSEWIPVTSVPATAFYGD